MPGPNQLLRAARKHAPSRRVPGTYMSREELAEAVALWATEHDSKRRDVAFDANHLGKLERGTVQCPRQVYVNALCAVLGATPAELGFDAVALATRPLRAMPDSHSRHSASRDVPGDPVSAGGVCVARSHKFVPVFIGAQAAAVLAAGGSWSRVDDQWMECRRRAVEHPGGSCQLYLWPFGVVVFHLIEDLALDSVAQLAVWRGITYDQNMRWAHDQLQALTTPHPVAGQPYVLSLYWVDEPAWQGNDLHTALRLMCIPRVLVPRTDTIDESCLDSATLAERALLDNGFEHPELIDFSMRGISLGYASWSGVVYHPIAHDRALHEDELVTCELSVQAIWAYCDYLRQHIEHGHDPIVPPEFGWRFLRGIRSRLTTERPQETTQHRSMRDAIVHTSGLHRHLTQALEILRDCDYATLTPASPPQWWN